jgi:uncharacterized membrane protein YeaQ/YmgE (transglycosylase-associated protein family)
MSLFDFIFLLFIAGVCGSLGQAIAGYDAGGCLVSIALGFIGALIGLYLQRLLELPILWDPFGFPVVWGIAGSAIFVALISLLRRPRRPID